MKVPQQAALGSGERKDRDVPPILLVDDDVDVLMVLKELIREMGFLVEAFENPREALSMMEQRRYCTVISDQVMPGLKGLDFLMAAQAIQPNATRILLTGNATLQLAVDSINKGEIFRFLLKPWTSEELVTTVQNAVSRFLILQENAALHEETLELNRCLKEANSALQVNFTRSISLCHSLMDTYHPLLGAYTRSVEEICRRIVETNLLTPEENKVLSLSASLHNIGLIGIQREVLSIAFHHPSQLMPIQRRHIEQHPIYGQTLAGFVGNLEGVGETIRAHHERWDGKGFPDGLSGTRIPRPARVLAVVCAYVESGLPHDEAVSYLNEHAGRAFAPGAVTGFLKISHNTRFPRKVRELDAHELRPGMVLAKNLYSPTGLLLLHEGQTLKREFLEKIKDHEILDHVQDRLLVYL